MDAEAFHRFLLGPPSDVATYEMDLVPVIDEARGNLPHSYVPGVVAIEHYADSHPEPSLSPSISKMWLAIRSLA